MQEEAAAKIASPVPTADMAQDAGRPEQASAGLFDRQLGRRVGLQALVRDRQTAANRASVDATVEPLLGALEGRQPLPEIGDT